MRNQGRKQPVVLLIDSKPATETRAIKEWLDQGRFQTRHATDVFEVMEEITDFTVRQCPDVILLELNKNSHHSARQLLGDSSGCPGSVEIFALAEVPETTGATTAAQGSFPRLRAKLDELIPVNAGGA
jgi:hypothetical protein